MITSLRIYNPREVGHQILERMVVAPGGQDGLIRRQRDGRKGSAFDREPPDELGGEMLGIGGRSPVAEDQQLPPVAERLLERGPLGLELHVRGVGEVAEHHLVGEDAEAVRAEVIEVRDAHPAKEHLTLDRDLPWTTENLD